MTENTSALQCLGEKKKGANMILPPSHPQSCLCHSVNHFINNIVVPPPPPSPTRSTVLWKCTFFFFKVPSPQTNLCGLNVHCNLSEQYSNDSILLLKTNVESGTRSGSGDDCYGPKPKNKNSITCPSKCTKIISGLSAFCSE